MIWCLFSESEGSDREYCNSFDLESMESVSPLNTSLDDAEGKLSMDSEDEFDFVNFEEWCFNLKKCRKAF